MIELKDICKSFGDHVVLKNFSLKINKNEILLQLLVRVGQEKLLF